MSNAKLMQFFPAMMVTIGVSILFSFVPGMWGQPRRTAVVNVPPGCELLLYASPPPDGSTKIKCRPPLPETLLAPD